jgi:hypothetical protein
VFRRLRLLHFRVFPSPFTTGFRVLSGWWFAAVQERLERDRLLFTLLRRSSTRRSLTKIFASSSASPASSEAGGRAAVRGCD